MRRKTTRRAAWAGKSNIVHRIVIMSFTLMLVCGFVLPQANLQAGELASENYEYYQILFTEPNDIDKLSQAGIEPLVIGDWGAYVRMDIDRANVLKSHFNLDKIPGRTTIHMEEQGLDIDTNSGYELARQWQNSETEQRIVQFVCPASAEWISSIEDITGPVLRSIGDNAIVVKASPKQEARISALNYVQYTGPYEPLFKVYKNLLGRTGDIDITATAAHDTEAMIEELTAIGARQIQDSHYGTATCRIDSSALSRIAKLDSVILIEYLPEMVPMCSASGRVVQAHDLWDNSVSNLPQNITGEGQIIHIQDTGLDATHRDFTMGPLGNRIMYAESTSDPDFHGTFMTGIAAGNGYDSAVYLGIEENDRIYNELAASNPAGYPDRMPFAGRAPEATIYSRAGLSDTEWVNGYAAGARIFSNSWGPSIFDNPYWSTADNFMSSNSGALVLFPAGSSGPMHNTVSGPGNGKLVISVGGFENIRPLQGDESDNPNQIRISSGRGPVADGRVKPDIVEISTNAYSTLSDDSASNTDGYELYDTIDTINTDTSDSLGDYYMMSGTSVSTAAASGDAILIRDYLVDIMGISNPHANLMKTLLIHGAEDMGYGYPSFDQGWGRVNVRNSICPAAPNTLQWYHDDTGISSGTWDARTDGGLTTWVTDNTVPLKITMTHWDITNSGTLSHDLDLVVTSPSGTRYEGNAFQEGWSRPINSPSDWANCAFPSWVDGDSYDWDTADDGGDDINNVEIFRVQYPQKGQWTVEVVWKSYSAMPFTIAMTGGFNSSADMNAASNEYKVSMELDAPRVIPERDDFGEAIYTVAPDGSIIVPYWINNGGTTDDNYALSTPIIPAGFTAFYSLSPVSLEAGERQHGYLNIQAASTVTAGTYTIAFKAQSNSDTTAPIAQSTIKFQIDVQTIETPPAMTIVNSPTQDDAPSMVSWESGGIDYVACAYRHEAQFGNRVYFTISADGGRTWSTPIPISEPSWSPEWVTITRATSGTYEGRLAIAYNAWNPGGYNDNIADTRCGYVKFHYSNDNGTTWSAAVDAWSLGQGVSTINNYRTVNLNWVSSVNQFYLTIESLIYDYSDLNSATLVAIDIIGKSSTDGGATWGSQVRINPDVVGMYYFFPHAVVDIDGNIACWFYEKDSGDAAQDRDLAFRYYDGSWGTLETAWDTTDNVMQPQGVAAPQGVNNNRNYCAVRKGANTDGDMQLYLIYTDNAGTGFVTNLGPLGPVVSKQDYGSRFLMDGDYTDDGNIWWTYLASQRYDPYGQTNVVTVHDDDYLTMDETVSYVTQDSYQKGKQRTANISEDGGKLLVAWNQMSKQGDIDIFGSIIFDEYDTAADTFGPVVEDMTVDKIVCYAGDIVTVAANINDWSTGGSNISTVQYKTDVNPFPSVEMQSMDGAFDSPVEAAESITTPINTAGWSAGWHTIWVRGQDSSGNWGAEESYNIFVNPQISATGTVIAPTGTGNVPGITISYAVEGTPTAMNLYYTTDTSAPYIWTLFGIDNPVDGSFAYSLPGSGTYGFKASAVGGLSLENSPPLSTEPPEAIYNYDTTAPNAPTNLIVDHWGPDMGYGSTVTETRYLRGVVNEATVNGLTCNSLGTTNSNTLGNWGPGSNVNIFLGMRIFKRSTAGVEIELTTDLSATVERTETSNGFQTATWTPPQTVLDAGDSIVMRVYGDITANPTTLRATFITEQLGMAQLEATEWTVQYWTKRAGTSQGGTDWYWGTPTYDNHIDGFSYTPVIARDPEQDNTLNWTASASPDVDYYNIYRCDNVGGPFILIGTAPAGTNTYIDSMAGTADAIIWWYKISAVDLASNEGADSFTMPEPWIPWFPYDIPIPVGYGTGDWVFVSFPYMISGNIETLLDDSIYGDGQTNWDMAKWYDPQDTADPWKSYSTLMPSLSDMPIFNNEMGVWLRLSSHGGDGVLSTGLIGDYSASNVAISLYSGWNLVGYPSATARLASVTLSGTGATMIATYQAVAPFVTDTTNLNSVTMSEGNAYWVHVPADTTWTVNP